MAQTRLLETVWRRTPSPRYHFEMTPGTGRAGRRPGGAGWGLLFGLVLAGGCQRNPAGRPVVASVDAASPVDARATDGPVGNDLGARPEDEPATLLRAAEFAWTQKSDRELARELLRAALDAINRRLGTPVPVVAALAAGLADPNFASEPRAEVAISAGSERLAIGHGRLLSVVDLHGLGRSPGDGEPPAQLIRLGESPTPLRRVVLDRDGERVATLADDGMTRLLYVNGDPGYQWPLLSPRDPKQPELPGTEAAYRASWLDFSPDARYLFLADCGVAATGACPLRRLRPFTTDRGQPLPAITAGELELVDYSARRDGTVAVLFAGRPPQLYQTSSGAELPLTSALPGELAQVCLAGTRPPLAGERGWLVSPERRWLATIAAPLKLAAPTTLCVWDLGTRQLSAAVALTGSGLTTLRLESLLSDQSAYAVVVSTADRASGRRTYLLDAQTGQRTAALAGSAAVMPLDDGGALLSGYQLDGGRRGGLQLQRLHPGGQLVRLPEPELPANRCLAAFPDAVAGDGGLALFSPLDPAASPDCTPALVELGPKPRPGARVRRLARLGNAPIAAADFLGTPGSLVIVDAAARLQTLVGSQVRYTSPAATAAVTKLSFALHGDGDQLLIGTADGQTTEIWITGGTLRALPPTAGIHRGPADKPEPPHAVSADGRLRAALVPLRGAGPQAPITLSLLDGSGAPRWQAPLMGLPPVTALAFTPDASLLVVGCAGGTVVWLRVPDGSQRLRLQLVPGGAVALSPDGRFELLGEVERPEDYVFCRAGTYQIPFSLCTGRLRTRGLLATALL